MSETKPFRRSVSCNPSGRGKWHEEVKVLYMKAAELKLLPPGSVKPEEFLSICFDIEAGSPDTEAVRTFAAYIKERNGFMEDIKYASLSRKGS